MIGDGMSSAKMLKATIDWRTEVGLLADTSGGSGGTGGLVNDYDAFGDSYGVGIGIAVGAITGGLAVGTAAVGLGAGIAVGGLTGFSGAMGVWGGELCSAWASLGIQYGEDLHDALHVKAPTFF